MITKTSIFCQKMPEKNELKDANPLKKEKKTTNICALETSESFAFKTV